MRLGLRCDDLALSGVDYGEEQERSSAASGTEVQTDDAQVQLMGDRNPH